MNEIISLGDSAKITLKGYYSIVLRDMEGNVLDRRDINNTLPNAGLALMASLILSDNPGSETGVDYIAIGIGTTAATSNDTALESEISTGGGSRTAGVGTRTTTTATNDTAQLVSTFTFTSSFAVTEIGVFNAASSGTMVSRQTFDAINVVSGTTLECTWKLAHADGG